MSRRRQRSGWKLHLTALTFLMAAQAFAGGNPTTAPMVYQGSGASNDNGEYLMSNLNGPARFFIEVPPGLTRLKVDIWDADVGQGGGGEANPGRDRTRGTFGTTASYQLFDPSGTQRLTGFSTGTTTLPALSDNQWLAFYDGTNLNVADNFGTAAYNNNDGANNWAGSWIEAGETVVPVGTGPGAGAIQVTGGRLQMQDGLIALTDTSLEREVNLSGHAQARFMFDLTTSGNLENGDQLVVQVSDNGGGAWTTLETFSNDQTVSRNYDISAFVATNTRVRFVANGPTGPEFFFLDNVRVDDGGAITAGHWEVRVFQTGNDDINAFGVRASDGDTTAGGTELNVYYDSIGGYGINPAPGNASRSYTHYPYITSGCTAIKNDFDFDSDSGTTGSIALRSQPAFGSLAALGVFSQTFASTSMSADGVWTPTAATLAANTINTWTNDQNATEYGMWTGTIGISTYTTPAVNGNYGHIYFSKSGTAVPPPTANPLPGNVAFRVYLPTDAVTRPAEPYLEQVLRYGGSGGNNGPNPPQDGMESIYTVTVRVVNPTNGTITFPGTNLVTANVPGAGTVYRNSPAQVSQGTVIAQPANGGTGNVTWNPGPIAAGANAVLAYRVGITPTAAIPRRIATGSGAAGTRASYVDQTGNTTQGRATYTFGPLCELAITIASLTPVVVSNVQTRESADGVVVQFDTASEVGATSFDLYRWVPATKKWLKVNDRPIPALINSPQGGRYVVKDPGASATQRYWYSVRETEAEGADKSYGPFEANAARDGVSAAEALDKAPRPRKPTAALLAASMASEATAAQAKAAKVVTPALKIGVRNTGLVLVSTETIAAHFGLSLAAAQAAIAGGKFNLTESGTRAAWLPASGGRGLLFYGESLDSPYDRDRVYWLRSAAGLVAQPIATGAPVAAEGGSFKGSIHAEIDALPALVVTTNPDSDYWFWDYLNAADSGLSTKSFPLNVPHLAPGANPSLTVRLSSATTSSLKNEHHVKVRVNGTLVADSIWKGIKAQVVKANLGQGVLHEGANEIQLEAILGSGISSSIVYVDSFDLDYPRYFAASDGALAFRGDGAASVTIGGFSDEHVIVLDVTKPHQPRLASNVLVDEAGGFYRASLAPTGAATPYYAVSESGWQAPAWTVGDQPSNLAKASAADYVVVTTHELLEPAERLANLRSSDGLSTLVVDIQDIYDEYAQGQQDPRALTDFLKAATKRWAHPPRYLVIAGRGNFDYRNLGGVGGNLVPPIMVSTPKGLFASDTALGDVAGNDGAPEIAVGRIPVLSAEEFDAYIDKVDAYENAPPPDAARVAVMAADAPDQSVDFGAASNSIAATLPSGYAAANVHLPLGGDIAVSREELFTLLDAGADFVNYTGHGALDRLSGEGLLTSADVPALHNARTPVLTALSCIINRFEVPGFAPLGEELVKADAGVVASWAPTGLSIHDEATVLGRSFYQDVAANPGTRLGDAINNAYRTFVTLGGQSWMPEIYGLLGDPGLRLKEGVVVDDPPQGSPDPATE